MKAKADARRWLVGSFWLCLCVLIAWAETLLGGPLTVLVRNTPQLRPVSRLLPETAVNLVVQITPGDAGETGAIYVPVTPGPHPGVLLVNGTEVPLGWRDPDIDTFARSVAELGEVVYVPDLPGLKDVRISAQALDALDADLAWFRGSGYARDGRISLLGVCVGGSLSLVAAANPANDGAVRSVVALDPYASLGDLLQAATTGKALLADGRTGAFDMASWVQADLVRGVAVPMMPDDTSRQLTLKTLAAAPSEAPFTGFRTLAAPDQLSQEGLAWWRLLGNTDASRFPLLEDALPADDRAEMQRLSPISLAGQLRVPVLIVAPVNDFAFPGGEAWRLQQANPRRVQLIRSSALDHVTPAFGPSLVGGYWQLLRFAVAGEALLR